MRASAWSDCPFPRDAENTSVDEAIVDLRVEVSETGRAEDVTVLRDPGLGFGEAARVCAMNASYDPGLDDQGSPIRATIQRFRIRFDRTSVNTERASPTKNPH